MEALVANTKVLAEVNEKDYDAIFYVGGHGPCFDLAVDPVSIALAETFFANGKPLAAVCHGPAAFHAVKVSAHPRFFIRAKC
jgi:putative intracellular protease/amidase